jgi:hypothetical protein
MFPKVMCSKSVVSVELVLCERNAFHCNGMLSFETATATEQMPFVSDILSSSYFLFILDILCR